MAAAQPNQKPEAKQSTNHSITTNYCTADWTNVDWTV